MRVVESRRGTHVAVYAIKSRQIHPLFEVLIDVLIEVLMRTNRVKEGHREEMMMP